MNIEDPIIENELHFTEPLIGAHVFIIILICSPIFFFKEKGRLNAALVIDILVK